MYLKDTSKNVQKLSEFPPIDFLRVYAFVQGWGRYAPPPGEIGLKVVSLCLAMFGQKIVLGIQIE